MPFLIFLLNAARGLVLLDAVLSFVQKPGDSPRSLTKAVLDPVYAPVRRLLAPASLPVDLAPIVALVVLYIVQKSIESGRARGRR